MGKDGDASEEKPDGEKSTSKEENAEEEIEKTEEKQKEAKSEQKEHKTSNEKEKGADALRKVIKVGSNEGENKKSEGNKEDDSIDDTEGAASRESLEQKRAILQSIKDFDFQIKKNQEEISNVNKKIEGMSKDLDDLVSLYEIVSEQMNPFVGLSKVTKKRLDALESFTREIDLLKERTGELESFAERSGAKLRNIEDIKSHAKTIDTDSLLGEDDEDSEAEVKEEIPIDGEGELSTEDTETEVDELETDIIDEEQEEDSVAKETYVMETQQYIPTQESNFGGLSDSELDMILEQAFGVLSPEGKVDMLIDEFIESLKG